MEIRHQFDQTWVHNMAPQKRTMDKKRWIKVGRVTLMKPHSNTSVHVRLVNQTPSTTMKAVKDSGITLPTIFENPSNPSHVMNASIQQSTKEMRSELINQGIPKEIVELMEICDKKALEISNLLQEQEVILSQISKYWEDYLKNN